MKTVLFVCVGNAGRSQMAEAFFNQAARGRARAISAGTKPASAVDPKAIEVMREVGIDISTAKPKALTVEMLEQADRVVTMGCGAEGVCPASFVETEDWQLEDPKDKPVEDVRRIRDEIRGRVARLIERSLPELRESGVLSELPRE
ncbi:MAG: arsenate reductase ArsC [Dehalococcoidia bacterium]|nr:arsenate reductase ArsC [Dehalococcoidia bacterium]